MPRDVETQTDLDTVRRFVAGFLSDGDVVHKLGTGRCGFVQHIEVGNEYINLYNDNLRRLFLELERRGKKPKPCGHCRW
jgi:hypothetical protein